MSTPIARFTRLLGFDAGPQNHRFYACDDCYPDLRDGQVMCFHALKGHDVEPLSQSEIDDETTCDLCREG